MGKRPLTCQLNNCQQRTIPVLYQLAGTRNGAVHASGGIMCPHHASHSGTTQQRPLKRAVSMQRFKAHRRISKHKATAASKAGGASEKPLSSLYPTNISDARRPSEEDVD